LQPRQDEFLRAPLQLVLLSNESCFDEANDSRSFDPEKFANRI
jgi:hypothetical protein